MTISSGGMNVNFNPTPSIYEKETSGQRAVQDGAEVPKGNVVIARDTDLIPFTKLGDPNVFAYKSESGRPSLKPMTTLRGSGALPSDRSDELKTNDEAIQDQLPDDVKLMLAGLPTFDTAILKFIVDFAANALDAQDKAHLQSQTENALNRTKENSRLPDDAYRNSLEIGKELTAHTEEWLEDDAGSLDGREFVELMKTLLKGTKHD